MRLRWRVLTILLTVLLFCFGYVLSGRATSQVILTGLTSIVLLALSVWLGLRLRNSRPPQ
jgi:hypothetical protein